ncbi:hypothetical protein QR680_009312 [Steinernema hermaphroditum]|uniref:Tyr recombinase domain-containing protein n=1 Tax=Steinernema hermaphroditum TaxID=289476 RepID=A0AA39ILX3_9BILA|nr:hypothetical protein QR680_009312 [Steinernema hermaphroditum]
MSLIASWKSPAPKDRRRIIAYVSLLFSGCLRPMEGASLRLLHMSYGSARREWKRLAAELGIKNPITLHGFRGGAATEAIKNGAPIDELMRFGRWKRVETLEAYVEVSNETVPTTSSAFSRLPKMP